jgi:hypothetical protein
MSTACVAMQRMSCPRKAMGMASCLEVWSVIESQLLVICMLSSAHQPLRRCSAHAEFAGTIISRTGRAFLRAKPSALSACGQVSRWACFSGNRGCNCRVTAIICPRVSSACTQVKKKIHFVPVFSANFLPRSHAPRGNALSDALRRRIHLLVQARRGASGRPFPRGAWERVTDRFFCQISFAAGRPARSITTFPADSQPALSCSPGECRHGASNSMPTLSKPAGSSRRAPRQTGPLSPVQLGHDGAGGPCPG